MNIGLQIAYHTVWGESVHAALTWTTKTGKKSREEVELSTTDGKVWRTETIVPTGATEVEYTYSIVCEDKPERREWTMVPHRVQLPHGVHRVQLVDRWRERPADGYLYSSAFTEAFVHHEPQPWPYAKGSRPLTIHVMAPTVPNGYTLAVLGSQPALGEWQVERAVRLAPVGPGEWAFSLDLGEVDATLEYKFLVVADSGDPKPTWELRDNRRLGTVSGEPHMGIVREDEPVALPFAPWRGAGCVVPVFSLRSEHSFGVGDFGDLRRMVDWAAETGMHALQILPINDTTLSGQWTDSYPYNCISIFALHPLYADLEALPPLADDALRTSYQDMQQRLNALANMDYEKVMDTKRSYLHHLFQQEWKNVQGSKAYKTFYTANADWLVPYAAFCYLRDKYETPDFRQWGTMKTYDPTAIERLNKRGTEFANEVDFACYVQFVLHEQLTDVHRHALERGVALKGDIPIGISPTSVEVWTQPQYFHLDGQAGAPPDYFSQNGQNWGFPTYNWERMLQDGCQWWRRRFEKMAEYFDAYRIDHVLGFFRIWEIPTDSVHGLLGQFVPALGMTPEEIEAFGLPWREETYTRPYITDRIIHRIFGEQTSEVRRLYLESTGNGHYAMKPEFDTQRKVEAAFAAKSDPASIQLRDGLYRLISNVLFVRDRRQPDMFHPRIVAMHDFLYEDLGDWEKEAFNRIHEHYFHHRHNQFWFEESMKKLPPLVAATRMLVCAEDLGMIPECVPWVMDRLGILTLEIQTMPKHSWMQFANLWENPYRSVATISTHDMPTLRQWWDEQRETSQQYYNQVLHHEGQAQHPMSSDIAQEIVCRHLESPSMLCLLSLQDWLAIDDEARNPHPEDERINVPANPRHYWRWRMHLSIEQLMGNTALNDKIRGLIKQSGR